MELLVKRDKTYLVPCEGRFEGDSDVPKNLRTPHIIPQREVMKLGSSSLEGKLFVTPNDSKWLDLHLSGESKERLLALWSGYRSALVRSDYGNLYKIKGVAWNPNKPA